MKFLFFLDGILRDEMLLLSMFCITKLSFCLDLLNSALFHSFQKYKDTSVTTLECILNVSIYLLEFCLILK